MGIPFLTRIMKAPLIGALRKGALIVDVRTPQEYDGGKIPGSINIPSAQIAINAQRLKDAGRPLVIVCSDNARLNEAIRTLSAKGVKQVHNGGNWKKLLHIVNEL